MASLDITIDEGYPIIVSAEANGSTIYETWQYDPITAVTRVRELARVLGNGTRIHVGGNQSGVVTDLLIASRVKSHKGQEYYVSQRDATVLTAPKVRTADFVAVGSAWREHGLTERGGKLRAYTRDAGPMNNYWFVLTEQGAQAHSPIPGKRGFWITDVSGAGSTSFERWGAVIIPGTEKEVDTLPTEVGA